MLLKNQSAVVLSIAIGVDFFGCPITIKIWWIGVEILVFWKKSLVSSSASAVDEKACLNV